MSIGNAFSSYKQGHDPVNAPYIPGISREKLARLIDQGILSYQGQDCVHDTQLGLFTMDGKYIGGWPDPTAKEKPVRKPG
jgi:hypothetical protein